MLRFQRSTYLQKPSKGVLVLQGHIDYKYTFNTGRYSWKLGTGFAYIQAAVQIKQRQ